MDDNYLLFAPSYLHLICGAITGPLFFTKFIRTNISDIVEYTLTIGAIAHYIRCVSKIWIPNQGEYSQFSNDFNGYCKVFAFILECEYCYSLNRQTFAMKSTFWINCTEYSTFDWFSAWKSWSSEQYQSRRIIDFQFVSNLIQTQIEIILKRSKFSSEKIISTWLYWATKSWLRTLLVCFSCLKFVGLFFRSN